jgi:hypothetical protein
MKVRIKATQLIEIPDGSEIVQSPSGKLIKIDGLYYKPDIEFMTSSEFDEKSMSFQEVDEDTCDVILGLKEEIVEIEQE